MAGPVAPVYRSRYGLPLRVGRAGAACHRPGRGCIVPRRGLRVHSGRSRGRNANVLRRLAIGCLLATATIGLASLAAAAEWWAPGDGRPLPAEALYANATGALGILNTAGTIDTRDHPFFEPIGTNGRACVTCHQPADAMALSVATVRERWDATGGQDPMFAAVDGMNCPHLPAGDPAAHSLLLERGLFRVASPWPPRDADGAPLPASSRSRSCAIRRAATRTPSTACSRRSRRCRCTAGRARSRTRST